MNPQRRQEIYRIARKQVLAPIWHRYCETHEGPAPSSFDVLPIRPDQFIREFLHLTLEEPEEIIPGWLQYRDSVGEIAGELERNRGRIAVSRKYSYVIRRFTLAHEIGHWFLHRNLVHHHDRPFTGVERSGERLPLVELEANLFAAEILMPRLQVADICHTRYGGRIHPEEIDDKLAFKISLGTIKNLSPGMLRAMSRRERSRLIALDAHAGLPMKDIFAVSVDAMSFRLEELDLIF